MDRRTVLVVDDHAPTRDAYAQFLADHGYGVLEAAHGGEAILHVHRHGPDVVLLDLAMPVVDGLETAESLRGCSRTARTRIIAMTGRGPGPELERMRSLCDQILSKPCTPQLVESRIRWLVEAA